MKFRGRVGALVVGAGLAVGCIATATTAQADSGVAPKQYWCPAEYFLPCDTWQSEFFQSPMMQSPLWQNPMVRVPWQQDAYD